MAGCSQPPDAPLKQAVEVLVELHGCNCGGSLEQEHREVPRPGADLEDVLRRKHLCCVHDAPQRLPVDQEVLSQGFLEHLPSLRPHPAPCDPGRRRSEHGSTTHRGTQRPGPSHVGAVAPNGL